MQPQIRHKTRAIATIIATLLMVAVAVVGGMSVLVFSQGFFQDTQIAAPMIENIEIFGYNATDSDTLGTHSGSSFVTGTKNNMIADGEQFAVFIKNSGGDDVLISEVSVFGVLFNAKITTGVLDTSSTANMEWVMSTDGINNCNCQLIRAGQEATIIIDYDSTVNGDVKIGKPIPVEITTGGGSGYTKQIVSGRDVG